ncbi:hypothetical protein TNCV_256971 [Trichonephila clavipes]|nr:hypothetical protein TNCV_256971 [Trichonephila clavipes]
MRETEAEFTRRLSALNVDRLANQRLHFARDEVSDWLDQGWRTNDTRANDGTRQNILGTPSIKNDLHFSLK